MRTCQVFFLVIIATLALLQPRSLGQEGTRSIIDPLTSEDGFNPDEFRTLRSQLLAFAPYASMHSRFRVASDDQSEAVAVLTEWTTLRETNEDLFSSRFQLKNAYRDLRAFMVRTESSAVPMLKQVKFPEPSINPFEYPELALAELIILASVEIGRNEALNAWSRDHDATCRASYARILPLLRQVFEKPTEGEESVHLRHWFVEGRGVFLEALNLSGHTLHNVTLYVRMYTLDGTWSDHYYFIPEWPEQKNGSEQHRYPLRIASDWSHVGAAATTSAKLEVISDEYVDRMLTIKFDDNIPTAADRILRLNSSLLKAGKQPAVVIDRARKLERHLGGFSQRRAQAKSQRIQAQEILDMMLDKLDQKIKGINKKIKDISPSNLRWKNKSKKERSAARAKLRKEIKKIEAEQREWKSGLR